eukprot:NODE_2021_length_1303_cov_28.605442_g1924_i0.p1 GENE.NODE_2021_length_1303_cov_28.605442_g1924_i0~~NODE_2021_length_1303_cov_28.605442_g1924_i0.p1  ORF type:complete len:418 (+),score=117.68 NODE_2021_length_1303_cov_28.605442_g1924_i0:74-1255(+)
MPASTLVSKKACKVVKAKPSTKKSKLPPTAPAAAEPKKQKTIEKATAALPTEVPTTIPPAESEKEQKVCYKCGFKGHAAKECQKMRSGTTTCFQCGNTGHFSRECPVQSAGGPCFKCGKPGHKPLRCPTESNRKVLLTGVPENATEEMIAARLPDLLSVHLIYKDNVFKGCALLVFHNVPQADAAVATGHITVCGQRCNMQLSAGMCQGCGETGHFQSQCPNSKLKAFIARLPAEANLADVQTQVQGAKGLYRVMADGVFQGFGYVLFRTAEDLQQAVYKREINLCGTTCVLDLPKGKSNVTCMKCGEIGHAAKNCENSRRQVVIGHVPAAATNEEILAKLPQVQLIRWARRNGEFLGFGFILFETEAAARAANEMESITVRGEKCTLRPQIK